MAEADMALLLWLYFPFCFCLLSFFPFFSWEIHFKICLLYFIQYQFMFCLVHLVSSFQVILLQSHVGRFAHSVLEMRKSGQKVTPTPPRGYEAAKSRVQLRVHAVSHSPQHEISVPQFHLENPLNYHPLLVKLKRAKIQEKHLAL